MVEEFAESPHAVYVGEVMKADWLEVAVVVVGSGAAGVGEWIVRLIVAPFVVSQSSIFILGCFCRYDQR